MPRVSDAYRARRLEELYRATWLCIAEIGVERTTITDIIEASGFSAGMVYNYFPGKDELIAAANQEAVRRARAAFESATSRPSSGPDELFERVVLATATRPDAGDNAMRAMWNMNVSGAATPETRAAVEGFLRSTVAEVARHVLSWHAARGDVVSPRVAKQDAELLLSLVLGFYAQQRFREAALGADVFAAIAAVRAHRNALRRLWRGTR